MNETSEVGQVPPALEAQVAPTGREKLFKRVLITLLILLIAGGVARHFIDSLDSRPVPRNQPVDSSSPFK